MFFSIALVTVQPTMYSYLLILFINFLPSRKCKARSESFACIPSSWNCACHIVTFTKYLSLGGSEEEGREEDGLLCLERVQQTRVTNHPSLPSSKTRNIPITHPALDQPTPLTSVIQGLD